MKLTAKIKLLPTEDQQQRLHETLQRANAAANSISDLAWEKRLFNKLNLHRECYRDVRERFGLSAQIVVRALGKVADAYRKVKRTKHQFKKHGAFPYDERILKSDVQAQTVSIRTLSGREIVPFAAGSRQLELLQYQKGETDLAFIRGEFYLLATCATAEPKPHIVTEYLGVDMGIANIATTNDGERYSGSHINQVRHRNRRLRTKLQKKGTKSAKRLLRKISGRERRFAHDVNHCISKAIVTKAKRTGRGIVVEALDGIRERVRLRRSQRTQLHSWAFQDLRLKISYKARLTGVPLTAVNPRYTSQMCSCCEAIDKRNRPNQSTFLCASCGFSAHADVNAAINIGRRAAVNPPDADALSA
jgi:putative transposase